MAFLVLVASVGVGVAISSADSTAGVKLDGGRKVTAETLKDPANQDVMERSYTVRQEDGSEDDPTFVRAGTSIKKLVELSGLNLSQVGYLVLDQAKRPGLIYLSRSEIANGFPEGPAVVFADGNSVRFVRPVRDSRDANAQDITAGSEGETLRVGVHTGNQLNVTVKASDPTPAKGSPVTFTATVTGGLPGEKTSVQWSFDDGSINSGNPVSHTYAKGVSGKARVTATVTGSRDSGGQGHTEVAVGPAKQGPGNLGNGGKNGHQEPGDGGSKGQLNDGGGISGDDSGDGNANGDGDDDGNGNGDDGASGDPGSSGSGAAVSSDSNLGLPTPPGTSPSSSPQAPPGPKDPTQVAPAGVDFETVSGVLVTDLSGAVPPSGGDQSSPDAAKPNSPSVATLPAVSNKSSSLTLPLTGVSVALLFIAGAGREMLRSGRRPV